MPGAPLLLGIESTTLGEAERRRFEVIRPAGYLLLGRNFESPEQTRALTDSLREIHDIDPILAIDDDHALLTGIGVLPPSAPGPFQLASDAKVPTIADRGAFTADLLRLLGINLVLAPRLDRAEETGSDPRLWHRDPQRIIDHAGMWNRWLRKHRLRSCARTFPGPRTEASLSELLAEDLIPYTALMPELDAVQVGHGCFEKIDPDHPASLSRRIVTGLLRDQLGFDHHLVITADLCDPAITCREPQGGALVAALKAGHDLAVVADQPSLIETFAAHLGEIPDLHRRDADRRIERFRERVHAPPAWDSSHWGKARTKLVR